MKSKLTLLLILLLAIKVNLASAQQQVNRPDVCPACVQYNYPEFKTIKDTITQNTYIETYIVLGGEVQKGAPHFDRKTTPFHADKGQVDLKKDYSNSGYAIGHINSAKNNAYSLASLTHSMLYINTDRQQQSMNAGPWLGLENHERDEAIRLDSIYVKAGVYGNIGYTNSPHHVGIGKLWWKALCYNDSTVVWVMPNVKMPQRTKDYLKPEFKRSLKYLTDTLHVDVNALDKKQVIAKN